MGEKRTEILRALKESRGWVKPVRVAQMVENIGSNRAPSNISEYEEKLRELEEEGLVEEDPNTRNVPERSEYDITEEGGELLEVGETVEEVWEEAGKGADIKLRYEEAGNVVEEARVLSEALETHTQSDLEDIVGLSSVSIGKKVKLLDLDERIIEFLEREKLTDYQAVLDYVGGESERFVDKVCGKIEERNIFIGRRKLRDIKEEVLDEIEGGEALEASKEDFWTCPFCGGRYDGKQGLARHLGFCESAPKNLPPPSQREYDVENKTLVWEGEGEPEGKEIALGKEWSEEEEKYLRENYGEISIEKISEELDRTEGAIRKKASDLGVRAGKYWKEEEIEFLKEHLEEMTDEEMGEELGRSEAAVQRKRHDLDLIKSQEKFTDEEFMDLYEEGLTDGAIAERLGVSRSTVSGRRRELDLESNAREITVGELNERVKKLEGGKEALELEREPDPMGTLDNLKRRVVTLEESFTRIEGDVEALSASVEDLEGGPNNGASEVRLNIKIGSKKFEFQGRKKDVASLVNDLGLTTGEK